MKKALARITRIVLLILLALLAGSLQFLPAPPVFAHSSLVRAQPAPNSVLQEPPARITIWFSEPIEPGFSEIQVLDGQGRRLDNRDSLVARGDIAMAVTLPVLPNGTYTVAWKNLSTVDGHPVRGSFVFSIGEPLAKVSQPGIQKQPILRSPAEPVLRWLGLVGILAAVGGLGFELLITRPVLRRRDASEAVRRLRERLTPRLLKVVWIAMAVFLAASAGQLLVQTAAVHDLPLYKTLGSPLASIIKDTDWGHLWLWRMNLLLAMAVVLGSGLAAAARQQGTSEFFQGFVRSAALALGGGVLLTLSLSSHGAALTEVRPAAVFSDYLHLLAAGFWVGGLFHFALGLPMLMRSLAAEERRSVLAALVPRFSTLATLSVGTLIITGIYSGWAQVTVISAVATPYGFTLLAKLALVAPLLLLGAFNLLWVRPRLAKEEKAGRWLRRFVIAEAILAALVLLSVGLLTTLEPARQVASRQIAAQESSLVFSDLVEGMRITLRIEPAQVGVNRVELSLVDVRGTPVSNASDVSLRLKYLNADLGENPATTVPAGQGKYVLEKALLTIAGPWQAELVVRRPDAFDARTAFRFNVALGAGPTGSVITPSPRTGKVLWAVELVLLGFLFLGVGILLDGWRTRTGAGVMAPGVAAVLAGLFLLYTSQIAGVRGPEPLRNPFPPNPKSLNVGQRLYQQNCQSCHGVTGRGDGPLAAGLKPPPLDLSVHVPLHPEEAVFHFIRDGVASTAMQPWRGKLTDEEIWHVVNYVKTLAKVGDR
jgi:copper transport protein